MTDSVIDGHYGRIPGPALLFCPADRPDRYAKALAAADGVILDLEDGVGPASKEAARAALLATPADPAKVIVRVNAVGTPDHDADLAALKQTAYTTIMLPKSEGADQFAGLADYGVIALVESSLGVLRVEAIAQVPNVLAVFWGAEDLMASMRGRSSRRQDGTYRDVALHARNVTLLAATAHGKLAVDAIYANIGDLDGLAAEAQDAAASGFALKACIHPSHVAVIRAAFRADDRQLAWARRVLAAATAGGQDGGAVKIDGQMIDAPLIRQAEAILASVGELSHYLPVTGYVSAIIAGTNIATAW
jgi:citrate lyase subunit beta/citryl-CoA lyase